MLFFSSTVKKSDGEYWRQLQVETIRQAKDNSTHNIRTADLKTELIVSKRWKYLSIKCQSIYCANDTGTGVNIVAFMLNAKFLHQIKSQSANNNQTHPVDDKRKYLMRYSMVVFIAHTFVTFICSTSSPIFSPSFLFSFFRSAFSSFQFFHPSNGNVTHNENEEGKKVFGRKKKCS